MPPVETSRIDITNSADSQELEDKSMTDMSHIDRVRQLNATDSAEVIDLNDDATQKEQESTPMSNMEEVDAESNADAGGDAEEFKSDITLDEGEYHTKEFQE